MIGSVNKAIITSILDTDIYKFHMQQAIWHLYPKTSVTLTFVCRDHENLLPFIPLIIEQISSMQDLVLGVDEYHFLKQTGFYKLDYLNYLLRYRFDPSEVSVTSDNGQLAISISGLWHKVVLWEVPILEIISEIRNSILYPKITEYDANIKLQHKISLLNSSSYEEFKLIEFGSRRRFSKRIQQFVLSELQSAVPKQLLGTSNCLLAKTYHLKAIGTQAHEWFQGHQSLAPNLKHFQQVALNNWLQEYAGKLGVALTDCINMSSFLVDFNKKLANQYSGLRQDSGDPIQWGEAAIEHYRKFDIDPMSKLLVFSDNLTIPKALSIFSHFQSTIPSCFGIGTNLTCDLQGVKPMNIVIKMTECDGKPVAKISDSPGKIICNDERYVQKLVDIFDLQHVKNY